jgi:hypothetical protein
VAGTVVAGAVVAGAVATVFGAQAESSMSVQIAIEIITKLFFISSSP